jgi:nicotinic acid phosphoribosyltransferase
MDEKANEKAGEKKDRENPVFFACRRRDYLAGAAAGAEAAAAAGAAGVAGAAFFAL